MRTNHHLEMTTEAVQRRREEVITLTKQGITAARIAQHLGITERSVQRHRAAAGLTQPVNYITEAELDAARQLLEDGASYRETANTIGRSESALINRLPGYGWNQSQACTYGRMRKLLDSLKASA